MRKLILVCGPAGIGKSTFCLNYKINHPEENVIILAADDVRKELCGSYLAFPKNKNMGIIYREMVVRGNKLAKANKDLTLMLDTTMLYDERRLFFVRNMNDFDLYSLILLKLHDYSKCLIRNKQRIQEKWVPDRVINDMSKSYVDPSEETKAYFDEIREIYLD